MRRQVLFPGFLWNIPSISPDRRPKCESTNSRAGETIPLCNLARYQRASYRGPRIDARRPALADWPFEVGAPGFAVEARRAETLSTRLRANYRGPRIDARRPALADWPFEVGAPGFAVEARRAETLSTRQRASYRGPRVDARRPALADWPFEVGAPGFEPGTSASRTQRSTGLSHAPTYLIPAAVFKRAKRATGFEPATSTLARLRSTS